MRERAEGQKLRRRREQRWNGRKVEEDSSGWMGRWAREGGDREVSRRGEVDAFPLAFHVPTYLYRILARPIQGFHGRPIARDSPDRDVSHGSDEFPRILRGIVFVKEPQNDAVRWIKRWRRWSSCTLRARNRRRE